MPSIYRKTAKGQAEIETRAHKLPPRLRMALIMVDGKRSDVELRPMLLQSPDETLATLLAQGFIEVALPAQAPVKTLTSAASAAPTAPASPAAQPGPPAAATVSTATGKTGATGASGSTPTAPVAAGTAPDMRPMPVPLPVRQREAVRMLTDQVGPMADAVAVRIEKARSADELRAAVLLGAQVIANTRGRQAAERYMLHFADL